MKRFFQAVIRGYQKNISPQFPSSCRFYPTCSNYGLQALEKHGVLKGGLMTGARIVRCNPFVEGGVDTVPDYFTLKRNPEVTEEDKRKFYQQMLDHHH